MHTYRGIDFDIDVIIHSGSGKYIPEYTLINNTGPKTIITSGEGVCHFGTDEIAEFSTKDEAIDACKMVVMKAIDDIVNK